MRDKYLHIHSLIPCIASITCSRVFLEMRGLFLHPGTENPPSYISDTLPPYHDPGSDQKYHLGSSRGHNHRNRLLDFLGSGGTTAQLTSTGVYELTTFEDTTFGVEVSPSAGFIGSPSSAPSTQPSNAPNHEQQHVCLATRYHIPPTASLPYENVQRKLEEGH